MICIDGNEKYEIAIYFTTFLLYGQTGETISYFRWKIFLLTFIASPYF